MKRRVLLLLLALLGLVVGAGWLVARLTEPTRPRPEAAPASPPPAPAASTLTPPEVKDPEEARRLELLIERRNAFRSLRDGFQGPTTTAPLVRLEPALRALWPGEPPPWSAACRGRVCRLTGPGEPVAWHARLLADAGVAAVADTISTDPDGVEPQAYVLVATGSAGSGEDFLASVEARIRTAPGLEACLKAMDRAIRVELMVDEAGLSYRPAGDGPAESLRCLVMSLAEVAGQVPVPPHIKAASRTVTFEPVR